MSSQDRLFDLATTPNVIYRHFCFTFTVYICAMITLVLYGVFSIAFSFLCSIWEAVILSVTPRYIRQLQAEKNPLGDTLNSYKEDIDRPLSAILSLNTIAHTVGAILVGSQAGALYGTAELKLGPIALSYEALIAGVMTLLILVLSEIIPKTIGANYWKSLTPFTVASLKILLFILGPLVWLSQLITKSLKNEKDKSVLSRADIFAIAEEGEEHGALQSSESTIIRNLIQLEKLSVRDIMTPRTVIMAAEESTTVTAFYKTHKPIRFSRIPVFSKQKDEITGVVLKDEILSSIAEDKHELPLSALRRDIQFVHDDLPLPELFDLFVENRIHMSVVVDSYGSLVGIVTMEDLFETILGLEITDEMDNVEDLQRLARQKWEKRAQALGLIQSEE